MTKLHKKLFYILVFFLPVNLGKHFIFNWVYVEGLLIDYLVPTIYFTDILIALILVLWIFSHENKVIPSNLRAFQVLVFFLFTLLLSIFTANRWEPSIYAFLRLLLYFLFSIYVFNVFDFNTDKLYIPTIFSVSVVFLSLMAIMQWILQSSVFDNYLFFGEQPYSYSTPGVAVKNFFGVGKIPPYATFRHPNVFAGFLCLVLMWIISKKSLLAKIAFLLGTIVLCLTLSKLAVTAFVLGLIFWILINKLGKFGFALAISTTFLIVILGVFFVYSPALMNIERFEGNPSIYRRSNFILSSIEMIKDSPFFGIGLNNNVVLIEKFIPLNRGLRFPQPVHNIFVLILAEAGIFAIAFFIATFVLLLNSLWKNRNSLFIVMLLQILIIGTFDHYFMTIHQTQILLWFIIGVSLKNIDISKRDTL